MTRAKDEGGRVGAGFTAGPWPITETGDGKRFVIGEGLVEGPNGYEVAEVYSDDCDFVVARANARLIAAAPDLYAALKEMCIQFGGLPAGDEKKQAAFDKAVDALAKATAESEAQP